MQLEGLRLAWCQLDSGAAVAAVADLLAFNSSLKEVDLRGNRFGDDGAPPSSTAMPSIIAHASGSSQTCRPSVCERDLRSNQYNEDSAALLERWLEMAPASTNSLHGGYICAAIAMAMTVLRHP